VFAQYSDVSVLCFTGMIYADLVKSVIRSVSLFDFTLHYHLGLL